MLELQAPSSGSTPSAIFSELKSAEPFSESSEPANLENFNASNEEKSGAARERRPVNKLSYGTGFAQQGLSAKVNFS